MDRSKNITRWWDLPAVFLVVVVLTVAFTRLIATQWTQDLGVTRTMAYLGLIAGLALGYSRFSSTIAALFGLAYGIYAVPWRLGQLAGQGVAWPERLNSIVSRLSIIVSQILKQEVVTDNLLFLLLMSILFWVLGVHAGYSLTRHASPWRTILPTGLTMVVIHNYDPYVASRVWLLVAYLFFGLVLVARLVYLQNRTRWQISHVYTPPHLGVDFIRITLIASAILLIFSWTVPALADTLPAAQDAWQRVKRPWDAVRDRFDNAFASLKSSVGIVNDFYGDNLSLGRGNRLSDSEIFTVLTPEEKPEGVRFYWRARVFDSFEDNRWTSTLKSTIDVTPEEFNLSFPYEKNRDPGTYTFSFTSATSIATLFVAPQPVWVSRPAKVELGSNEDGTVDIATIRASPSIKPGDVYHERSSLSGVTMKDMRAAGVEYPQWVKDRYLQLPPTITERTRQLARQITEGIDTPYDKAWAITAYLRNNIEYIETIEDLPNNRDLVDWFLFDYRKGFCNYYATAEVVLLRSLGIPARMAVGYAQGAFDEITNTYTVRQRDAHAWPEVYFPGVGWVEFEPTAGQPDLIRPTGESLDNSEDALNPNTPPANSEPLIPLEDRRGAGGSVFSRAISSTRNLVILGIAGALLALIIVPILRRKRFHEKLPALPILLDAGLRRFGIHPPAFIRRWARHAALPPLAKAYMEINFALRRLGRHPSLTDTPRERAAALARTIPEANVSANRLVTEYQTGTYSYQPTADLDTASQAGHEIRSLSLRAWFQRLLRGKEEDPKEKLYRSARW